MMILLKKSIIYLFILNSLMGCTKQNNDVNKSFIKNTRWRIIDYSNVILSFYEDTYEFKNVDGTIREYGNYSYDGYSITFEKISQTSNYPNQVKYISTYTLEIIEKSYNMITLKGFIVVNTGYGRPAEANIYWGLAKN